ncbi:MAG: class I tRNA ligase family protein, partial [Planctomycetaceae bacterium]|nr:class I tRNA ligase family protein [Planctomycetaceae bacterium]
IKESIPEFLLRLWNVYSFFVIYAGIDKFDPAAELPGAVGELSAQDLARAPGYRPVPQRSELDRWILSELQGTAAEVVEKMDAYDNYAACQRITAFVDALSNWYVRRSRDRFWSGAHDADKLDAYWTLYECLLTTSKIVAPFVPFLAETLWQNLAVGEFGGRATESVHLTTFPTGDAAARDELLSQRMNLAREIVSLGRAARMTAKLKVRQPLERVEVILADTTHQPWLEQHAALVAEELNVKRVEYATKADQYISYTVLPDLKRLGPKLGKRLPALKQALAAADPAALMAGLEASGSVALDVAGESIALDREELQIRLAAKPGWAAAQGHDVVVVVATEVSDELKREGLARELTHAVQTQRKDLGCAYTDRIEIGIVGASGEVAAALDQFGDYVRSETLAVSLSQAPLAGVEPLGVELAGQQLQLYVRAKN